MAPQERRAAGMLFAAAALAIYWRTGYFGYYDGDFATLVERFYRVAIGQVIYRDFHCISAPLTYFIQGALLRLFGHALAAMRWYVSLQGGLMCAFIFLFTRRYLGMSVRQSLLCGLISFLWSIQLICAIPWYNADAYFFILLAIWSFCRIWGKGSRWDDFLFGMFCSLAFWCKQDLGAAALMLGAVLFIVEWLRFPKNRTPWRPLVCLAGAVIPFLIFGAYFMFHGALGRAWYFMVFRAILFRWDLSGAGLPTKVFLTLFGDRSQTGKLLLLVYVLGVLMPLRRRISGPEDRADLYLRNACISLFAGGIFCSDRCFRLLLYLVIKRAENQ